MYFCKNCGQAYPADDAVMCAKCGVSRGRGYRYCHGCGSMLDSGQTVCMYCGVTQVTRRAAEDSGAKNKYVAGLLGIFFGCFGAHNFYLGYTRKAIMQLTGTVAGGLAGCFGLGTIVVIEIAIWGCVEGILILCGKIRVDGHGNPIMD